MEILEIYKEARLVKIKKKITIVTSYTFLFKVGQFKIIENAMSF